MTEHLIGLANTRYYGRLWDSPMTDDSLPVTDLPEGFCALCQEGFAEGDDILLLPHLRTHLECLLRSTLGDVDHLEGRCVCVPGGDHSEATDETSWRDQGRATVTWLIEHGRGRFA